MVSILPHFGSVRRGQTAGDLAVRRKYRIDPEWPKPFNDPDKIAERLINIIVPVISPEKNKAVQQSLHKYDLRKKGTNPVNDPKRIVMDIFCG